MIVLVDFINQKILPSSSVSKAEDVLNVNGEFVRKLSFSLQLSSPDDYEGGDVEFLSVGERDSFTAPKDQEIESMELDAALEIIAAKAAKGPSKFRKRKK